MLAVVTTPTTRLDAGAVGLALARCWSAAGLSVLFVDAAREGSTLAKRVGETSRTGFSPADRGLPSLMVSREEPQLRTLANHCYDLEVSAGSLWALFGPFNADAAALAMQWLSEHVDPMTSIDAVRRVIVATSLQHEPSPLNPLLLAAEVLVIVAPVSDADAARQLRQLCADAGVMVFGRNHRLLVVEGACELGDEELHLQTELHVAGRLPVVDDDRMLRERPHRRDRAVGGELDKVASRVSALIGLYESERTPSPEAAESPSFSKLRRLLSSLRPAAAPPAGHDGDDREPTNGHAGHSDAESTGDDDLAAGARELVSEGPAS